MTDNAARLGLGAQPPSASNFAGVLPIANGGTNSSAALSGSSIAISNGTGIVQGAAGTTTTVLHGNAAGAPTYGAVALATDVSGTLPAANLPSVIRLAASDCAAHAVSSGTGETVLKTYSFSVASLPTIAAHSLIMVRTLWTYTNSGNNKTIRVRFGAAGAGTGGTIVSSQVATTTATAGRDVYIFVRTTSSQVVQATAQLSHEAAASGALVSPAINVAADFEIVITGQTASSGETITLEASAVEIQIP